MVDENSSEHYKIQENGFNWRACLIAPAGALLAILFLTVMASVFGPRLKVQNGNLKTPRIVLDRREAFAEFGREFFAIAHKADQVNERAFVELSKLARHNGDLARVQDAFSDASLANKNASSRYKALVVPGVLVSREQLRQAADLMSSAYTARSRACDIVVLWASSPQSKDIAQKYSSQIGKIDVLTMKSLRILVLAAKDNGIAIDDLRRLLP
ncbi:MAG: hypothetical protein K6T99_02990 [Armatimonadetes bacterium]|nr:hypothetical protein [Armatimonadota bacterium]